MYVELAIRFLKLRVMTYVCRSLSADGVMDFSLPCLLAVVKEHAELLSSIFHKFESVAVLNSDSSCMPTVIDLFSEMAIFFFHFKGVPLCKNFIFCSCS